MPCALEGLRELLGFAVAEGGAEGRVGLLVRSPALRAERLAEVGLKVARESGLCFSWSFHELQCHYEKKNNEYVIKIKNRLSSNKGKKPKTV